MMGLYNDKSVTYLYYGIVNSLTFEFTLLRPLRYLNSQDLSFVVLGQIAINQEDYLGTFIVGTGFSGADVATFNIINGEVVALGGTDPSQPQGMLWINP